MDQKMHKQMETLLKEALSNVATKDDLKNFATKKDLERLATKRDLEPFATKDDIRGLRTEFKHDLDEAIGQILGAVDKGKADRETVEDLEIRVSALEEKRTTKN